MDAMDDEELVAVCCQKMQISALRPGQGDVIRNLLTNRPCLAVMPTIVNLIEMKNFIRLFCCAEITTRTSAIIHTSHLTPVT